MSKSVSEFRESAIGAQPTICEPKRKRAYHRALKRGEHWATYKKAMFDMINTINRAMYEDVLKPSPFLKMLNTAALAGAQKDE